MPVWLQHYILAADVGDYFKDRDAGQDSPTFEME